MASGLLKFVVSRIEILEIVCPNLGFILLGLVRREAGEAFYDLAVQPRFLTQRNQVLPICFPNRSSLGSRVGLESSHTAAI